MVTCLVLHLFNNHLLVSYYMPSRFWVYKGELDPALIKLHTKVEVIEYS